MMLYLDAGFGPLEYAKSPQNWFDAAIVIISFLEIAMGGVCNMHESPLHSTP